MERVRKKGMSRPEDAIQRAVFKHFAARAAPGVFALHPKNGGVHQKGRRAGINSGLGVVSGVPDIIAFRPIPGGCKAFGLELKVSDKEATDEQLATLKRMERAGVIVGVAAGLDAALRFLEDNELLVGRVS